MTKNYLQTELNDLIQTDAEIFAFLERAALDGLWYWDLENPDQGWMSETFWQTLGFDPGSKQHLSSEWQDLIHPQDLQRFIENLEKHSRDPQHPYDQIARYRHSDGSTVWVRCRGIAIRGESGQALRLLGAHTDVTDLMQLDQERKKYETLLAEAETLTNSGAWEWDMSRQTFSFSGQWHKIHGTGGNALTPKQLKLLMHPADREKIEEAFQAAVERQEPYDIEHRIIRQNDGKVREIRTLGRVHLDENGQPARILGTSQEITYDRSLKRKLLRSKAELQRRNEELMQFSYRASHDLKAPLTSIKGLAKFAIEDVRSGDYDEASKNMMKVGELAESLEGLVTGLLEVAITDIRKLEPESIDFDSLLSEIESHYALSLENKGVRLQKRIDQSSECYLPRARVFQILSNLISNGINYADPSEDEKFVRVEIKVLNESVCMEVEDNGVGIPESDENEIYQMFVRYHPFEKSGSGIGMYMVKKNVDAMNGNIEFVSSREGTRFTVQLSSSAVRR